MAVVILKQSWGLLYSTWGELTDAGVSKSTRQSLQRIVQPLVQTESSPLLGVTDIRARKAGSLMFVDLTAIVPKELSMLDVQRLDEEITETLKKERKEVAEVRIKFHTNPEQTKS